MVSHIIEMCVELSEIILKKRTNGSNKESVHDLIESISSEISTVGASNFPTGLRKEYIALRQYFNKLSKIQAFQLSVDISNKSLRMKDILELFHDIPATSDKKFTFLHDSELRDIIERDYIELNNILLPSRAWKSTVVLAGSVMEAILFDVLKNPVRRSSAMSASSAPRRRGPNSQVKDIDEWSLQNLIDVSVELLLLPADRKELLDISLRNFRNFVHPMKEIRSKYSCGETEANFAKYGVDLVHNYLQERL